MAKDWISKAIKHPGALRKTAAAHGGINKQGNISEKFLEQAAAGKYGSKTEKRADLAKTLKGFHKK